MHNILSADFFRLRKSRLFRFFIAAEICWSALLSWLVYDSVSVFGLIYLKTNLNLYLYMPVFYLCVAEALFCGFFIGTDYSDGTIRNKIIVGQTRIKIYFSNLIISCFVGIAILLTHIVTFTLCGFILVGPNIFPSQMLLIKTLCGIFTVITCASLFTLISILYSKMAAAATTNIFISLGLMAVGMFAYAFYNKPQFLPDGTANYRYVGGAARVLLEAVESVLPTSAALEIMSHDSIWVCLRIAIGALAVSIVFSSVGLGLFKNKNIH